MMHANNQVTVKPQVEQHIFTYVDVHSLLLVGKILLGEYDITYITIIMEQYDQVISLDHSFQYVVFKDCVNRFDYSIFVST